MNIKKKLTKKQKQLGLLLWFRLSRFYNESVQHSNANLKAHGLTTSQFDVLAQVGAHQPLSQQELAEKLFVTKGNITHMLRKMEDMGYIQREQKWRTKTITLTAAGNSLYKQSVPDQEQFQAMQFQVLSEKEQQQLLYLLKKIQKNPVSHKEENL